MNAITPKGQRARTLGLLRRNAKVAARNVAPDGFRIVPGSNNRYSASADGDIFSHFHNRLLKPLMGSRGYWNVTIKMEGYRKRPWDVHRLVMLAFVGNPQHGCDVDHINRDKSDNRLENLRYVGTSLNAHNAIKPKLKPYTKFRGVTFIRLGAPEHKWFARLQGLGRRRVSPSVATDREAAELYDAMALEIFGACAVTNKSLGLL